MRKRTSREFFSVCALLNNLFCFEFCVYLQHMLSDCFRIELICLTDESQPIWGEQLPFVPGPAQFRIILNLLFCHGSFHLTTPSGPFVMPYFSITWVSQFTISSFPENSQRIR